MGNKVGKVRELEGRDWNFFPFLSFSTELTHTTYAAFVSMQFSALNYNWGITHALRAWGKYCILSRFYLSSTFAQSLLLLGVGWGGTQTSALWNHVKDALYKRWPKNRTFLAVRGTIFPSHLISEEWMIPLLIQTRKSSSLLCDSSYSQGLITGAAAPPVPSHCWLGIWQNIRISSLPANEQTLSPNIW